MYQIVEAVELFALCNLVIISTLLMIMYQKSQGMFSYYKVII